MIESSPVAESLILFVEGMNTDHWEGPPTKLYKALTDITDQIQPELKRSNLWPRASNKLTFRIKEIAPNLKEKGIEVITGEKDKEGNWVFRINKMQPKQKKEADNKTTEEGEENVPEKDRLFNIHIHRLGYSDTFECDRCPLKGDIHYMKQHACSKV